MFTHDTSLIELRQQRYELGTKVEQIRREIYQQIDPTSSPILLDELVLAEEQLALIENKVNEALEDDPQSGLILDSSDSTSGTMYGIRGEETTGLEVRIHLRMAQIPTAIYHLLDHEQTPLLSCEVHVSGGNDSKRRVRVTSFIEGYSAKAINTFEIRSDDTHHFDQLPTLFHQNIRDVNELTRATLNILVEDLDGSVEIHETHPVWLLARTTAPLSIRDPKTGQLTDMTRYFGAYVTPNAIPLMKFLRIAADHHPAKRLVGYQGQKDSVFLQVKALYEALKTEAQITYVNSLICSNPEQGFFAQRVRLPRESLEDRQANCIDGTVLFASLLEGISLNPAIVLIPGHAFLAWETWRNSGKWEYLETTMVASHTYDEACASARKLAEKFTSLNQITMWPLNKLRAEYGIMSME